MSSAAFKIGKEECFYKYLLMCSLVSISTQDNDGFLVNCKTIEPFWETLSPTLVLSSNLSFESIEQCLR